eukprot:scaffold413_cov176-Ochromonas_danica.AAC.25
MTDKGLSEEEEEEAESVSVKKGILLKRKDFLHVDQRAQSHPNRTYYFKRIQDVDGTDPKNGKAYYLRGSSYFKKGQLSQAITDLTEAIALQPNHLESYYYRGMALTRVENFTAALTDLSHVLKVNPDHINASFARAALYNQMGLFPQAIEDYNVALSKDIQSISLSPKDRTGSGNTGGVGEDDHSAIATEGRSRNYSVDTFSGSLFSPATVNSDGPMHTTPQSQQNGLNASSTNNNGSGNSHGKIKKMDSIHANGLFSLYSAPAEGLAATEDNLESNIDDRMRKTSPVRSRHGQDNEKVANDYHAKGYAYRKEGDFNRAIECYTQALQIFPQHFKSLFNRGFAYDKLGQYALAIEDYSRALTISPQHAYVYYNRGITLDHMQHFDKAIEDFTKALQIQPHHLDFLYNRGYCYRKINKFSLAIHDFTDMINTILQSIENVHAMEKNEITLPRQKMLYKAYYHRAYCYEQCHQVPLAIQDMNTILAQVLPSSNHLPSLTYRASLFEQSKQYQQAIQDYSIILNLDRKNVFAWKGRAKANIAVGQYQPAIHDLSQFLVNMPDQDGGDNGLGRMEGFYLRGLCYKSVMGHSEAVEDFSHVIDIFQRQRSEHDMDMEVEEMAWNAYHHRGYCYRKLEKLPLALEDYCQLIQFMTNFQSKNTSRNRQPASFQTMLIRAYNNRAFIYAKLNNLHAAIQDYTVSISLDPQNAHAYHNRGLMYDKLGQLDQAMADFGKSFELDSAQTYDPMNGRKLGGNATMASKDSGARARTGSIGDGMMSISSNASIGSFQSSQAFPNMQSSATITTTGGVIAANTSNRLTSSTINSRPVAVGVNELSRSFIAVRKLDGSPLRIADLSIDSRSMPSPAPTLLTARSFSSSSLRTSASNGLNIPQSGTSNTGNKVPLPPNSTNHGRSITPNSLQRPSVAALPPPPMQASISSSQYVLTGSSANTGSAIPNTSYGAFRNPVPMASNTVPSTNDDIGVGRQSISNSNSSMINTSGPVPASKMQPAIRQQPQEWKRGEAIDAASYLASLASKGVNQSDEVNNDRSLKLGATLRSLSTSLPNDIDLVAPGRFSNR